MKRSANKSHCPINYSLELVGDPWALLIIRDIVYFGKKTFGEFLHSEERIATNILTSRLRLLEQRGVLRRQQSGEDRRKDVYTLTEAGVALIPVILELAQWGATHDPLTDAPPEWIELVRSDKENMTLLISDTVRQGGAIFAGEDSVIVKLSKTRA